MKKIMSKSQVANTETLLRKAGMLVELESFKEQVKKGLIDVREKAPRTGHIDFILDLVIKEALQSVLNTLDKISTNTSYELDSDSPSLTKGEVEKIALLKEVPYKVRRNITGYSLNISTKSVFLNKEGKEIAKK
jgi:hypothetical protein